MKGLRPGRSGGNKRPCPEVGEGPMPAVSPGHGERRVRSERSVLLPPSGRGAREGGLPP